MFLLFFSFFWVSLVSANLHVCVYCMQLLPWWFNNDFLEIDCSELGARREFLGTSERQSHLNHKKLLSIISQANQRVRGGWKRSQSKFQRWKTSWTDPWILGPWSWRSRQWEPQGSVQVGGPIWPMPSDAWGPPVPPRSACWTCSTFWTNPATRKCTRWIWRTSPWSRSWRHAALCGRPSVMSSWPWREKNGGIGIRSPGGCGGWASGHALDPRICWASSGPWALVRGFWWPAWKRRPKRRTTTCLCKKWLELNFILFLTPKLKDKDLELRVVDMVFESLFVVGIRKQPPRQAWTRSRMSFLCKCNHWHLNVSAWRKKNLRDRSMHCRCSNFSLSANTWEKGRRKVNLCAWRKNLRDKSIHCRCNNFSLSVNTWEKGRRKVSLCAWRKNLRDRSIHCRCNNFSLSAKTWDNGRRKVNLCAWRKNFKDRHSHCNCKRCNCNNFSLRTNNWRRKSSSSRVSWRPPTPSSPRWNNSAMNARNVMLKMSLSQTARGSCARSWLKLLVYLLTQLAIASWGRLSSRRGKFLLRKWNWSLPTWRALQ